MQKQIMNQKKVVREVKKLLKEEKMEISQFLLNKIMDFKS